MSSCPTVRARIQARDGPRRSPASGRFPFLRLVLVFEINPSNLVDFAFPQLKVTCSAEVGLSSDHNRTV